MLSLVSLHVDKNAVDDKIQPDVPTDIKDEDKQPSEKEAKVETQFSSIQSMDEESGQDLKESPLEQKIHKIEQEHNSKIRCAATVVLGILVAIIVSALVVAAIVVGYTTLLLKSLPGTDISDELQPYEKTIDGVTGWDINAIGGFPVLMDGFNPTWVNRTVRESGVLSDLTWRFDSTCSDAMKEEMKRRGTTMADAKPRAVPCEGNSSKRCLRVPFHMHAHGSYVENRYAADGSSLTYRGLFNQEIFSNPVSVVTSKNPLFVSATKMYVDVTKGKPRVLNFPPAPKLPEKTKKLDKLAGTCVDPHQLPTWYVEDRKYKFSKGMKRPFNMLIQTMTSKSTFSALESALDNTHLDDMLNAMTTHNAGPDSVKKAWNRRDKGAAHVPSTSAIAFVKCLHFNGDHPESRGHPQRCVNLNQNEVVVAEEVGKVGQRKWEVKNKQAHEQACSKKKDVDNCVKKDVRDWGHECGYVIVPLEQELLTFSGVSQFDPEAPEGRNLEIMAGRTIFKYEDSQLVLFTENLQLFALNEKPSPDGPPAYVASMEVAPVTWGGPAPSSVDGRGHVPGLATLPYDYTRSKTRMKSMHLMYFNLYKGKRVFSGGCGMPDKDYFWSDSQQCHDTAEVEKTFNVLREVALAKYSSAIVRDPKFTDTFASAYAFVETLGCSSDFLRSGRDRSHGIDWLEQGVWMHQLAEYPLGVNLDALVRRKYWNNLKPVNGKCARL